MAGFFGMFDYTKPGKGVSKEDLDKSGIALYFDILARRVWKLFTANIIFIIASIPAIVINWAVSAVLIVFLQSITGVEIEPAAISMLQIFVTAILLLFCGSGGASAAMSYVLRKYVNDTHSWVWSDFVDNFKSNLLQGTAAYIINIVVTFLMAASFLFYSFLMQGMMALILRTVVAVVGIIFLMMQMYVYQIMATLKLKVKDIYRNALLLTLGKLPWNIFSFGVTLLFVYLLNFIVGSPIVLLVLFFIFYSIIMFTQIFMTNNIVNKYLVEPSENAENKISDDLQEESTFSDDVTQREDTEE